ncbi:DUF4253 domain-containing protein [Streptomyces sp. NPDC046985]|uniref:DUF4253 domain-containing protein n=1 Tax=Streptomyces sp. NPDC046985 TaxID=3155377 RepID=UPI0033EA390B
MATLPNPLPKLAADPSGRSLGLPLPPGRLIDATDDGPWHEPLLWCSGRAVSPGNWAALGGSGARVGLLPVLVDLGDAQGGPEHWQLTPGETTYPGDHDAEEVLAEHWAECAPEEDGPWPGLAGPQTLTAAPDVRAAEVADALAQAGSWPKDPHLALVPARRSADIPAAIGWSGPLNHDEDVARLCAVLRSWEDRFGIRVTALGFDWLTVSVAAPPTSRAEAEAVAAEHAAFSPDTLASAKSLPSYADSLPGAHSWHFWWD